MTNKIGDTMTLAIDKTSGRMAQEIRDSGVKINTATHKLEDRKYVLDKDGKWYDYGVVNNENKYPNRGSVALDYVQKKYPMTQTTNYPDWAKNAAEGISNNPDISSTVGKVLTGGYNIGKRIAKPFVGTAKNIGTAAITLPQALVAALVGAFNPQAGARIASPNILGTQTYAGQVSANPKKAFVDQLKNSIELGSYAIPFGKGANFLTRATLPGAARGTIFQFNEDNPTPATLAGGALLGGTAATALYGLGALTGTMKGLRGQNQTSRTLNIKAGEEKLKDMQNMIKTGGPANSQDYVLTSRGLIPKVDTKISGLPGNTFADVARAMPANQPNATVGSLQEASQTSRGLGLLAKFDKFSQVGDKHGMAQVAEEIMKASPSSPLFPYAQSFQNLYNRLGLGKYSSFIPTDFRFQNLSQQPPPPWRQ